MAKGKPGPVAGTFEVQCPCCDAMLQIDPQLKAVIHHKAKEKAPTIEDFGEAVRKLKGEEARRDALFQKSFADHKTHQQVLDRKFDQLLKEAKESPDVAPPKRPFDLD